MERKFWRALGWPVALVFIFLCPALWAYSGGSGEPNNPYQIATAEDLIALGNEPNDYNDCFILTADIDLSAYVFDRAVIAPDMNQLFDTFQGTAFTGIFNGQDYVIRNLSIEGCSYVGLFGCVGEGALISKVGLECVDVNGFRYVGGLTGLNSGFITLGYSNGTVKGQECVGGLVGLNSNGRIQLSYACGSVEGRILPSDCGFVQGWMYVGGLVGVNENENATITSCYSHCSVTVEEGYVGGLVGANFSGQIKSCYCVGRVVPSSSLSGGLVGNVSYGDGNTTQCFWDIDTSGQEHSDGGIGLTTQEMQDPNTFSQAGWDLTFEIANGTRDSWEIQDGNYPCLAVPVEPNGMGTSGSPYLICDINELGAVWNYPQSHFVLDANLDFSGITWRSAVVPWFEGNFEGGGHVIENLYIEGGGTLGLFGQLVSGAIVSSLHLESVDVNGDGDHIGSLVGFCQQGEIVACRSHGDVRGIADVGGLVGYLSADSQVSKSYSSASVTGEYSVGGLVGANKGRVVCSCGRSGSINGNEYVGGLVGTSNGDVISSHCSVSVAGDYAIGGLVGGGGSGGTVAFSYSTGNVHGQSFVGGVIGYNRGGTVSSCFYDIETSGISNSTHGGIGLVTVEMQDSDTYLDAGWDFVGETVNGTEDIWWMPESDYPRLWWE